ncbi:hypothetical protein V2J09_015846 [Rumex salicifolius]
MERTYQNDNQVKPQPEQNDDCANHEHCAVSTSYLVEVYQGEGVAPASDSDNHNCQCSSSTSNTSNSAHGNSESWMELSIAGDKPAPRFNHAAAVVGTKMVVVGGESVSGALDDVQVLNFEKFSWTAASSNVHLSPTSLPLKIPACKGHSLVARSGHAVVRVGSHLLLFGGEDSKRRKLNDLYMFELKSMTWLPLHCTGARPSPRSNHVAAFYDDRTLFVFGGSSKSKTLNDFYALDFEMMVWSRIKIQGFHPSPRAGSCGVLCGTKWYIVGGGSRKKRHEETVVFDVIKHEWSVAFTSPPYSITTNKGFSLVLMQHKERDFLIAFGGCKKEPFNQDHKPPDMGSLSSTSGKVITEVITSTSELKNTDVHISASVPEEDTNFPEIDDISAAFSSPSTMSHLYETKMATLMRKSGALEEQLVAALADQETAHNNLFSVQKSRQELEKKVYDVMKEMESLKEKVVGLELAQEEANMVHSDNLRLEHDVAFLKAVLDDTQKELISTRGMLKNERTRAFQLQVEVFHLKQRLQQSLEIRSPTSRKPFQL